MDLTYDPTDVQVNVGCDPFGGDIYCSLLTGPVTEGDFFAVGSPFNLLVPGFADGARRGAPRKPSRPLWDLTIRKRGLP